MFLLWKKITELLAVLIFRILTVDTLKDLFWTILRTLCILLLFSSIPGITVFIPILQRGRMRCIETKVMKYRRRWPCWNIMLVIGVEYALPLPHHAITQLQLHLTYSIRSRVTLYQIIFRSCPMTQDDE